MVEYSTIEPWQRVNEHGLVFDQGSLMAFFYDLLDPRHARGKRYSLVTLLTLVFLAKLSGMDSPSAIADWCQAHRAELVERLHLRYAGMPGHSTFRRLFAEVIDEDRFEQRLRSYTAQQRGDPADSCLRVIDGKKERGTIPPGETQGEATMAVYDPERQEVIAQMAIDPQEGEIPTGQKLLAQVDLKGMIVLADALHTQRKLCRQIGQAGGAYLLTVKDNQPNLYQDIATLFTLAQPHPNLLDYQTVRKTNKRHGRIEQRTLTAVSLFPGEIDWPDITQVFRLENTFSFLRKGQLVRTEQKVRYGLTSLSRKQANAQRLLTLKRKYWQIETGLHYRRDVTFHEDTTRMSHPHATRNLTTVHNTILSLFARLGCHNAAQTRRRLGADLRLAVSLLISAHPRL
jgi:predicted transposase YbfD/YdcC